MLDNSLFDLLETVMIFIENLLGLLQVEIVFRGFRPWQRNHPIQIIAQRGGLGRIRMHTFQASKLPFGFFGHLGRHFGLFDFPAVLLDLFLQFISFTQFLLDRFHLLAKVKLALALIHLATGLRVDVVLNFQDSDFFRHQLMNTPQARYRIQQLEDLLRSIDFQIEIGGHQVREPARIIDLGCDRHEIG